ncbi:hypothetical protein GGH98_003328, partial [Coemansia sp. RSA 454]
MSLLDDYADYQSSARHHQQNGAQSSAAAFSSQPQDGLALDVNEFHTVLCAQVGGLFSAKDYVQSAECFAHMSVNFEGVVLRFMGKKDNMVLQSYLVAKLKMMCKQDHTNNFRADFGQVLVKVSTANSGQFISTS